MDLHACFHFFGIGDSKYLLFLNLTTETDQEVSQLISFEMNIVVFMEKLMST